MNSEPNFWIKVWAIIGITLITIVTTISITCYYDNKMKIKAGMEQVTAQGYQGYIWQYKK